MKRLVLCAALAVFAINASGMAPRSSGELPKPPEGGEMVTLKLSVSNWLPPQHQFHLRGIWWVNVSPVPCRIIFYREPSMFLVFSVDCLGLDTVHGNLKDLQSDKPVYIRKE